VVNHKVFQQGQMVAKTLQIQSRQSSTENFHCFQQEECSEVLGLDEPRYCHEAFADQMLQIKREELRKRLKRGRGEGDKSLA
jgi:hypothetical protein